jgi:hypothetical protein
MAAIESPAVFKIRISVLLVTGAGKWPIIDERIMASPFIRESCVSIVVNNFERRLI